MKFVWVWLAASVIAIFTFSSWIFVKPFDYEYLKERFDTSQWRDAFSQRIISDNELYQVAGVQLWRGADIFSINPEVPPLGKYLYGASAGVLGNPHWASLVWFVAGLVFFYLLSREFFSRNESAWVLLFLLLNPLFFTQLTQTMLDLPQMVTLLIHIWAMVKLVKQPRNHWWLAAGISLGAFAAIKVPILVPLILIADAWWLYKHKLLKWIMAITALSGFVYVATFATYFIQGHSLLDWLRSEKWTFEFYRTGSVRSFPLTFPITTLAGWYKGWWGDPWLQATEWTIIWPLVLVGAFHHLKKDLKQHSQLPWMYLKALFFLFALSFIVLPFWTRYFLLILPLGILCLLRWLKTFKHTYFILVALVVGLSLQALFFFLPSPFQTLKFVEESWERGQYRDMYSFLRDTDQSRLAFSQTMEEYDQLWHTQQREIHFVTPPVLPWQSTTQTNVQTMYYTFDGVKQASFTLQLVRDTNQWLIIWPANPLPSPSSK